MAYVDGFVIAVPKDKIDAYKAVARKACRIFQEYGALQYVECVGDDVKEGEISFPQAVKAAPDDYIVFSWIVYESRQHRDRIMKQVMEDDRLQMDAQNMPFDPKHMIVGGFKTMIEMKLH